jgi:flavin-binding protein dodecin
MIIYKIQQLIGMTDDTATTVIEQAVLRLRKTTDCRKLTLATD